MGWLIYPWSFVCSYSCLQWWTAIWGYDVIQSNTHKFRKVVSVEVVERQRVEMHLCDNESQRPSSTVANVDPLFMNDLSTFYACFEVSTEHALTNATLAVGSKRHNFSAVGIDCLSLSEMWGEPLREQKRSSRWHSWETVKIMCWSASTCVYNNIQSVLRQLRCSQLL